MIEEEKNSTVNLEHLAKLMLKIQEHGYNIESVKTKEDKITLKLRLSYRPATLSIPHYNS